MQALLSFENAPPFAAPLRFFLTAPVFAIFAGLLLAWGGADLLASRWAPGVLAATHLLTVGFMLQVMLGALIQILPVVAGANLPKPLLVSRIVHLGLTLGAPLLAAGFLFGAPALLSGGAFLLGATCIFFFVVCAWALRGVPSTSPTIRGLKLALAGLLGVVGLGIVLATGLAFGWSLPLSLPALADLHAGWGLGGWGGVLLAAMAYVVVPMFQLTPGYPARPSWWFPIFMLLVLLVWTFAVLGDLGWLARLAQGLAAVAGIAFCGLTLHLQGKRRRAKADATYRYWQLGLTSSIVALAMLLASALWPAVTELDAWTPAFGILIIAGGFLPFITGMLYKIAAFLSWLHLQNFGQAKIPAPAMNKILADADTLRQTMAYGVALAMLLVAVLVPAWMARPAGAAFAFANGWLFWNLLGAVRRYRRAQGEMAARLAAL